MRDDFAFERLVGESPWTARTLRRILQAAAYNYPVLITGPAGTGKELIARAIHQHSPRSRERIIPFRCSKARGPLGLAQLFGQTAGAFAWMPSATMGCCQAADGGTLLLEEVGDLDSEAQARLLELVTTKRPRPLGGEPRRALNVRIVATSTRDLREDVREKQFSFELLYRLNALTVETTALRERTEDVAPLVRHIMARVTMEQGISLRQLTPAALALLESYSWPGNVAELERVVEHAVLAWPHRDVLDADCFAELLADLIDDREAQLNWPEDLSSSVSARESISEVSRDMSRPVNSFEAIPTMELTAGVWRSLDEVAASHLRETFQLAQGNELIAARLLKISVDEFRRRWREATGDTGLGIPKSDVPSAVDRLPG